MCAPIRRDNVGSARVTTSFKSTGSRGPALLAAEREQLSKQLTGARCASDDGVGLGLVGMRLVDLHRQPAGAFADRLQQLLDVGGHCRSDVTNLPEPPRLPQLFLEGRLVSDVDEDRSTTASSPGVPATTTADSMTRRICPSVRVRHASTADVRPLAASRASISSRPASAARGSPFVCTSASSASTYPTILRRRRRCTE